MASAAEETEMVPFADLVSAGELLSLTVMVKLDEPLVVGVPEITPPEDKERPDGKLPAVIDQM